MSFHPQTFSNTKRKDHISPHHLTTTPIPISLFAVSWFPHLCVTCLCHCSSFLLPSLPSFPRPAGADCGDGQTVVVTAGGSVYAWGCFKDKEGKKWFSPTPGSSDPKSTIK